MIHLRQVSKAFEEGPGYRVALEPTDLDIPTDRRVAVLGGGDLDKSMFLNMLVGSEAPTRGEVLTQARLSPSYRYGTLFQRALSLTQNVQFFARLFRIDVNPLYAELYAVCRRGGGGLDGGDGEDGELRRRMEFAMLGLLPFDCYVVNDLWGVADPMREWFFQSVASRRGGVIFGANQARLARLYGQAALVIRDGRVHPFVDVEEGIAFHERG